MKTAVITCVKVPRGHLEGMSPLQKDLYLVSHVFFPRFFVRMNGPVKSRVLGALEIAAAAAANVITVGLRRKSQTSSYGVANRSFFGGEGGGGMLKI